MVSLTGSPGSAVLVRRAARMAMRTKAELVGVHVRTDDGLTGPGSQGLRQNRALLDDLGGRYVEVVGADVAPALVQVARAENATQLVLGATHRSRLTEFVRGSVINSVIRAAGGSLDVHVIATGAIPGAAADEPTAGGPAPAEGSDATRRRGLARHNRRLLSPLSVRRRTAALIIGVDRLPPPDPGADRGTQQCRPVHRPELLPGAGGHRGRHRWGVAGWAGRGGRLPVVQLLLRPAGPYLHHRRRPGHPGPGDVPGHRGCGERAGRPLGPADGRGHPGPRRCPDAGPGGRPHGGPRGQSATGRARGPAGGVPPPVGGGTALRPRRRTGRSDRRLRGAGPDVVRRGRRRQPASGGTGRGHSGPPPHRSRASGPPGTGAHRRGPGHPVRLRRPAGHGPGERPAPGRGGRGRLAGPGQPAALGSAGRGQPRPAHTAGLHQGRVVQPPLRPVGVRPRGDPHPPPHHRRRVRPPQQPGREPVGHESTPDRLDGRPGPQHRRPRAHRGGRGQPGAEG